MITADLQEFTKEHNLIFFTDVLKEPNTEQFMNIWFTAEAHSDFIDDKWKCLIVKNDDATKNDLNSVYSIIKISIYARLNAFNDKGKLENDSYAVDVTVTSGLLDYHFIIENDIDEICAGMIADEITQFIESECDLMNFSGQKLLDYGLFNFDSEDCSDF